MNHQKNAYLKIANLEKELILNKNSKNETNTLIEFQYPNINEQINKTNLFEYDFPSLKVVKDQAICFQFKISVATKTNNHLSAKLYVDNTLIHSDSKTYTTEEGDFIILKSFIPTTSKEINLSIKLVSENESLIKSLSLIVLGATTSSTISNIELRTLELSNSKTLISYIEQDKLYYSIEELEQKNIDIQNFQYFIPAKSHSFALNKVISEDTNEQNILLFRVDPTGDLFYSYFNKTNEILIDQNIKHVFATTCPTDSNEDIIFSYIKDNGLCYYRTLTKNIISEEKELPIPNGKYIDIHIVSEPNNKYIYILATNSEGSNFIVRSQVDSITGDIIENINCSFGIVVSKYIDLRNIYNNNNKDFLNLSLSFNINSKLKYNEFIEKISKENLYIKYELNSTTYKIEEDIDEEEITYGIQLDKSSLIPGIWETYTDDAINFTPAKMNFETQKFEDNGWLNRWPYNQIKPCLIKDGKVVGYLNQNNFNLFEDGTNANITNPNSGNVMIEFPYVCFSLSTSDNYINVKISNILKEGFIDTPFYYKGVKKDKIYISAYLCDGPDFNTAGFHSTSGVNIQNVSAIGYETCYQYLSLTGNNYEFMPFNTLTLLQCLYLIMFRNTNSQKQLGYGYGTMQSSPLTGVLNDKGMFYGVAEKGTSVKCFGLEDFYGTRKILCPGFYIDQNYIAKFINVYDPNSSYSPDYTDNYIPTKESTVLKGGTLTRVATDIYGDPNLGFFYKAKTTDTSIGFCDSMSYKYKSKACEYGLTLSNDGVGVFGFSTTNQNYQYAYLSIRLVYYPEN